ncbi:PIN-like domain-containing protein [Spirillospora sp. NPDC000708]
MTDEASDDGAQTAEASSLRGLFPWHFGPPAGAELERFLTEGLVVFDTNALFDAYRLNPQGREEFLRTLGLLGDQLWVPHRVAEEFLRNRLGIINECAGAVGKLTQDLKGSFNKIKADLESFRSRRGLEKALVDGLVRELGEVQQQIVEKISEYYRFDLKAADCLTGDPILSEIEQLLDGRVGPPLKNMQQVREDAAYRFERRIPPGYADANKPAEEAIGDYVLWVQLLQEVERRPRPVLFVTNESKKAEDWTVKQPGGRSPLPRPELSAEVRQRAGQPFHIVDVRSFLELANEYMDAQVSEETITQAEEIRGEDSEETAAASPVEEKLTYALGRDEYPAPALGSAQVLERALRNLTVSGAIEQAMRNLNATSPIERALRNLNAANPIERAMRNLNATGAIEQAMRNLQAPYQGHPTGHQDPSVAEDEEEDEPPEDEAQ